MRTPEILIIVFTALVGTLCVVGAHQIADGESLMEWSSAMMGITAVSILGQIFVLSHSQRDRNGRT